MLFASCPERIWQDAFLVHRDTDQTHAEFVGSRLHSGERQGLSQHHVAWRCHRHECVEQDGLIAWIDHQTLGVRIRHARAQPFCSNFALVVAAAGILIVQECAEAGRVLDGLQPLRDAQVEIGLHRLRRQVHRKIDLDLKGNIPRGSRGRFRNECPASHLRLEQPAPAGLAIRACHRREIDVQGARQRAMRRNFLAAHQPSAGNFGRQGVDDAQEHWSLPLG